MRQYVRLYNTCIVRRTLFAFLFVLFAISTATYCYGQDGRAALETKRNALLQKIATTSKLIKRTKANKNAAYDRLTALQQLIKAREELIQTLQEELMLAEHQLSDNHENIQKLEKDLELLSAEYAAILRTAYRQKQTQADLLFIFSSDSFNQAFRRMQYLRQYNRYRKKQAERIAKSKQEMDSEVQALEALRKEKEALLIAEEEQQQQLIAEEEEKQQIVRNLKRDESRLRKELQTQRKARKELDVAIERMIQKEIQRKEAAKQNPLALAPNVRILSEKFIENKGQLPWPVNKGIVIKPYGRQPHPTIPNITVSNNGIDFRTEQDASVKAIFKGEVVGRQFVPGYAYMVIIRHGVFYTVYSNLKEVLVKKGDDIVAGQAIGVVRSDPKTESATVHFEVWKNKIRLNPSYWLKM